MLQPVGLADPLISSVQLSSGRMPKGVRVAVVVREISPLNTTVFELGQTRLTVPKVPVTKLDHWISLGMYL